MQSANFNKGHGIICENVMFVVEIIIERQVDYFIFVVEEITNAWTKERAIMSILKNKLISVFLKQHKFQHFKRSDLKKKVPSSLNLQKMHQNEAYINSRDFCNLSHLMKPILTVGTFVIYLTKISLY
jgi:GTPase Era involved in 16S rRNA processing